MHARVILAAPGIRNEPGLVAAALIAGVEVARRPVDAADLLAAATMEPTTAVVVGAELPRLSLDVIARLEPTRRRVIGLVDGVDAVDSVESQRQRAQLEVFGLTDVIACHAEPTETMSQIAAHLASHQDQSPVPQVSSDTDVWEEILPTGKGRLIAVWGPAGAPGRSALTIELSAELARKRQRTCTVDADTYAPSLAMRLGVLDDVSGLIVACRHADNGSLATRSLLSTTRLIDDRWYLLTGLGRSERWPDLRPAALERVWSTCRKTFDTTIIDVGSCLEAGHPMSLPGFAVERNEASRSALTRANGVVAVTRPDALSVTRLLNALPQVRELTTGTLVCVAMTHVDRRDRRPARLRELLLRAGFDLPVNEIPVDARSYGRA
ncbi:MAG: CpaE family protein, partial [Actinomycetales bacterium]